MRRLGCEHGSIATLTAMSTVSLSRRTSEARPPFALLALLLASLAVFVHHVSPGMDGMGGSEHTCVAVFAHASSTPVAPAVMVAVSLAFSFAALISLTPLLRRSRRLLGPRAGPPGLLLQLRC